MANTATTSQQTIGVGHTSSFDVERIRREFPILRRTVNGQPLVYLDNAATSQKPQSVIDALSRYYSEFNANIHRSVHTLSAEATKAYEDVRGQVQSFVGATSAEEIVFVRGATEAINLVAYSFLMPRLSAGDEIVVTTLEHHSNIVPWQLLCEQTGARLRVVPINDAGELELDAYVELLGPRTKMVAVAYVSNALGTINPLAEMISAAHEHGVPVIVDAAQAAPHMGIDVGKLGCDFLAITGHKMFGPTGIGALYGRRGLLEEMRPYQGGGEMIRSVTFEKTTYNAVPHKFEAGTPNIAGTIGLGAAIEFLNDVGMDAVAAYEHELLEYATARLAGIDEVRLFGTARAKAAIVSFNVRGIHAHDLGTILDIHRGVAVRSGHHCAQPVMDRLGVPATVRASLALYNTKEDVDALVEGVKKALEVFAE